MQRSDPVSTQIPPGKLSVQEPCHTDPNKRQTLFTAVDRSDHLETRDVPALKGQQNETEIRSVRCVEHYSTKVLEAGNY